MNAALRPLLARWRTEPSIGGNIAAWRTLPAHPPEYRPLPAELHPALRAALRAQGIEALYTHQALVWKHVQRGEHSLLCTPTASGKTLAYNLPVLDALLRSPEATALYLFPAKALAQDQLLALPLAPSGEGSAALYDGDTAAAARPAIRKRARLLLTNPDMLHFGILPYHTRWARFFRGLRFVVLDEIHAYRGVFGSHVANLLRRLERIARFYGAAPRFLLTSATIGNPQEHAHRLIGQPVRLVSHSGAPRGRRHILFYNPPVVDKALGLRSGVLTETAHLAADLLACGLQTLVFTRSRRSAEWLLRTLRRSRSPGTQQADAEETLRAYHSNYLPAERRRMERGLRSGRIRLAVATNALELGVDLGGMQAVLLAGYPGAIASAWQQAGRAGRGAGDSLAVLVAGAAPLDQFLMRHPEYFFGRSPERALINPNHPLLLLDHLRCALYELPFDAKTAFGSLSPQETRTFLDVLLRRGEAHPAGGRYLWAAEGYPAAEVSLRSASARRITLDTPQGRLATIDAPSAPAFVHPGAVYLHNARPYLVETLDLQAGRASLHPADDIPYYTRAQGQTEVLLRTTLERAPLPGGQRARGDLEVSSRVTGFRQLAWEDNLPLGEFPLELPAETLFTQGFWISLTETGVEQLAAAAMWDSAPNDYGPGWPARREAARARDGYRCRMCGAPERGRAHHVHHKTPFRLFRNPAEANRLDNLVTLCPACHRRAEQAVRVHSGLAGLGYLLHHLAPLLLMCDPGDLGRHSHPRSPLAAGQPAVLLYERIPGGLGFSTQLFERYTELLAMARQRIAECPCEDGCPSCTGPGGEDGSGGKAAAGAMLDMLAEGR